MPWFALGLGSNILLPDEGLDALVIRLGKGLDRLERDGDRWAVGAGLPAPLAARRTAAAGLRRAPHLRRRARDRGRRGLHERRLPRRRLVRGGGVGHGGGRGGARRGAAPRARFPSPTGEAGWTAVSWWRPRSGSGRRSSTGSTSRSPRCSSGASSGTPFNQPCCGSVFKNPGGPELEARGRPADRGPADRGGGTQGLPGRRRGGVADARQLLREHRRRHRGGRAGADRAGRSGGWRSEFGALLEPEVKLIGRRGEYLNLSAVTLNEAKEAMAGHGPLHFAQGDTVHSTGHETCPTTSPTNPPTSTTAPSSATGPRSGTSATSCPARSSASGATWARTSWSWAAPRLGNNVKVQNNVSIYEGVDPGGRRLLRAELRVHQRDQPPQPRLPEVRVPAHPGAAGQLDRGERHHRLRRDPGRVLLHRRGGGGPERRAGLRPDGRSAGPAGRLDVPVRRPACSSRTGAPLALRAARPTGSGRGSCSRLTAPRSAG